MNNMQREYIKKWLKGLAIAGWIILCIVSITMGKPWHWFALGSMIAVAALIAFAMFYIPIAIVIWYWRLMGVCENEAEENVLKAYWFWIRRSESWVNYLKEDVCDRYSDNENSRTILLNFIDKLSKVKKPRWL